MGSIWIARDPQLGRQVAVKRLAHGSIAPIALERFQQEAMAAAKLSHPNVVHVYDYGTESGSPYIVMELLTGEDLETKLHRAKTLPLAAANEIVQQVARALTAAHGAGLVHRDLKPANIFLARGDAGETVKVLDFGIAAMRGDAGSDKAPSSPGKLVGTPAYMSPEQARGRPVDHRSDLWSAAVVAYVMLTGVTPFSPHSRADLIGAICSDQIPPPSSHNKELSPQVDAFFVRALARDPRKRFQSAAELAAAFADLLDPGDERRPKILLVDDEPDMALLLKQWFQERIDAGDFELLFAAGGEHALSLLRAHPDVEVILSDIRMPGMDGLSLLLAVADFAPIAKVVMVSAYGDMANIRLAMNRGAFDFLFKPIDFRDLEITIEKALRQAAQARRVMQESEENKVMRYFVHRGMLERVLPLVRGSGAGDAEALVGTVLILDVCGSARLLREEPPDRVMSVINTVLEIALEEIAARSGLIERFIGDAVLALFLGADHEERAAEAALASREAIAARAQHMGASSPYAHGVTAGLESGTLISGALGSKSLFRLEGVVLGAAVATAARLEVLAAKDEILVGPAICAALAPRFACEPHEARDDAGPIYRLVRAFGAPRAKGVLPTTIDMTPDEEDSDGKSGK